MKTITIISLALVLGCSNDSKDPNDPNITLTEKDKSKTLERAIDGAPGMSLVFTRERDDGWRKIELVIAGARHVFHGDPSRFMLDANGQGFGDRAVICGMATPDVGLANLDITCAVADPVGLGPLKQIKTPTSAWLGDVCVDGDRVTLLYASGTRPIEPETPLDAPPCLALGWNPASGWDSTAAPSATCACNMRDGLACDDPCFVGAGVRRDGACDTTGLAPKCNDGDPATDDFCTGKLDELCYAVPRM
jgi:hypothetical protein